MRLDGFGSGRMNRSGMLRSMGIGRGSGDDVRALSMRVSGAVDWLLIVAIAVAHRCTLAILGVLGVSLTVGTALGSTVGRSERAAAAVVAGLVL